MCVLVIVCEPDEDVHRVHCKIRAICTAMLCTECAVRVVCVCALCVRA